MMPSLKDILHDLLAAKTRFILTIIAIAWGTISIASMLAIGEGLRTAFNQAMQGVGKGLLFVQPGQTKHFVPGIGVNINILFNQYDYQAIKHLPLAKFVHPEFSTQVTLRNHEKSYATSVLGIQPHYKEIKYIIPQKPGRFINEYDYQHARRVIVLGNEVKQALFNPDENPLGKRILVGNIPFTVIGVMQDKLQLFSVSQHDKYVVWIPDTTFKELAPTLIIPTFLIVPKDINLIGALKHQILNVIGINHRLNPSDTSMVKFVDSAEIQERTDDFFFGMQIFLGLIGVLTLLVAGSGIANVMYASVNQSTRDIGIRMALGARSEQILVHYITESLLATAIGGILGLLGTLGFTKLIAHFMRYQSFSIIRDLGYPQPILSFKVIFIVILVLGVIGLLAGLLPARKAALINPVRALRYE